LVKVEVTEGQEKGDAFHASCGFTGVLKMKGGWGGVEFGRRERTNWLSGKGREKTSGSHLGIVFEGEEGRKSGLTEVTGMVGTGALRGNWTAR